MNIKRSDIEIMAPVGCMESLHAAIAAGADAIYFGVGVLNMRARSSVNFTLDDLAEIVRTAHEADVRTYLTVNTILYDNEMEDMRAIVDRAAIEGVDAIIAADYFNVRKRLVGYHKEPAARKHLHRFTVKLVIFRKRFEQIQSRCAYGSRTLINTIAYTNCHVPVETSIVLLVNTLMPS